MWPTAIPVGELQTAEATLPPQPRAQGHYRLLQASTHNPGGPARPRETSGLRARVPSDCQPRKGLGLALKDCLIGPRSGQDPSRGGPENIGGVGAVAGTLTHSSPSLVSTHTSISK